MVARLECGVLAVPVHTALTGINYRAPGGFARGMAGRSSEPSRRHKGRDTNCQFRRGFRHDDPSFVFWYLQLMKSPPGRWHIDLSQPNAKDEARICGEYRKAAGAVAEALIHLPAVGSASNWRIRAIALYVSASGCIYLDDVSAGAPTETVIHVGVDIALSPSPSCRHRCYQETESDNEFLHLSLLRLLLPPYLWSFAVTNSVQTKISTSGYQEQFR
jgi:hypothetical protein